MSHDGVLARIASGWIFPVIRNILNTLVLLLILTEGKKVCGGPKQGSSGVHFDIQRALHWIIRELDRRPFYRQHRVVHHRCGGVANAASKLATWLKEIRFWELRIAYDTQFAGSSNSIVM